MALRIWCNPQYFPAATQGVALAAATAVLRRSEVTLEQVLELQVYIDTVLDSPEDDTGTPEGMDIVEEIWFEAIHAAEAAAGLSECTPLGSMLVLDGLDERLRNTPPGAAPH